MTKSRKKIKFICFHPNGEDDFIFVHRDGTYVRVSGGRDIIAENKVRMTVQTTKEYWEETGWRPVIELP